MMAMDRRNYKILDNTTNTKRSTLHHPNTPLSHDRTLETVIPASVANYSLLIQLFSGTDLGFWLAIVLKTLSASIDTPCV